MYFELIVSKNCHISIVSLLRFLQEFYLNILQIICIKK